MSEHSRDQDSIFFTFPSSLDEATVSSWLWFATLCKVNTGIHCSLVSKWWTVCCVRKGVDRPAVSDFFFFFLNFLKRSSDIIQKSLALHVWVHPLLFKSKWTQIWLCQDMVRFPRGLLGHLCTRVFLELCSVAFYSAGWRAWGWQV